MIRTSIVRAPLGLLLPLTISVWALAQETAPPFRYETQKVDDPFARRAAALASALGFAAWPRTSDLYAMPAVGTSLLRDPAAVQDEVRSCTTVPFGDEGWPQCTWSWKGRRTELRNRPGEDWLDIQITMAPSSQAAQEYLLRALADNQLPTEMLIARCKAAERPENLGDVAFVVSGPRGTDTTVSFLRGNLVVRARGHGALAAEGRPLAARLDERVAGQTPLTKEELRARAREPLERR